MLFSDMLYMLVRYASTSGHMCLRCLMLTLSGHLELLLLLCLISTWTCVVVSVILVVCSLSVSYLGVFCVCFMFAILVKCLLNTFSICLAKVNVFSLTVMLFWGSVG